MSAGFARRSTSACQLVPPFKQWVDSIEVVGEIMNSNVFNRIDALMKAQKKQQKDMNLYLKLGEKPMIIGKAGRVHHISGIWMK